MTIKERTQNIGPPVLYLIVSPTSEPISNERFGTRDPYAKLPTERKTMCNLRFIKSPPCPVAGLLDSHNAWIRKWVAGHEKQVTRNGFSTSSRWSKHAVDSTQARRVSSLARCGTFYRSRRHEYKPLGVESKPDAPAPV